MTIRFLAFVLAVVFTEAVSMGADVVGEKQTRMDFEEMAEQMPYLSPTWIYFDCPDDPSSFVNPRIPAEHVKILTKARDPKYPKEALLALLSHRDAKVRTLAAAILYDREDASVLPALAALHNDKALTYFSYPVVNQERFRFSGCGPPIREQQTVGGIVKDMLRCYMERSGYYYGIEYATQPGFAEYWKERKDRSYCAGWFAFQLYRMTHDTESKEYQEKIRIVRKRIDQLPEEDRTWTLLFLNVGAVGLVTEAELVEACKKTGPEKLLLMLQNKIPSDDPDLQPPFDSNVHGYKYMVDFVLQHAPQVLRPGDCDALLACEQLHEQIEKDGGKAPISTPWWVIAAASVRPDRASQILHDALDRSRKEHEAKLHGEFCRVNPNGRKLQFMWHAEKTSPFCAALWRIVGSSESDFLVEWFYEDIQEPVFEMADRVPFVEAVGQDPTGKEIIGKIIKDPRFPVTNGPLILKMLEVVNRWSKEPIVTEGEIRKAWHPMVSVYSTLPADAEQKYPKETQDLWALLRDWHKRLCTSMPDGVQK